MKLLILTTLSTASLLLFSGCSNTEVKAPQKEMPIDNTLPIIKLTKNGVYSDMNAIAFEWHSLDDSRVKGIYVYKQDSDSIQKHKHRLHETITNRFVTHYIDDNVSPNTKYAYSFKTFSRNAQSKSSNIINVNSLPVLSSVSWAHSVTGMPRSAKLIWRPHTNRQVSAYIIERKAKDEEKYTKVAEVKGRLHAEYIDTDLKDNNVYKYQIRVRTYDNIISSPSKTLQATTKVLPKMVQNIDATTTLPKKIKITWDKSEDKDFYQYHLYRSKLNENDYTLIATLYNNKYTDIIEKDGAKFQYRVSALDHDGLESLYKQHTILASTLATPKTPVLTKPVLDANSITIKWENIDKRTTNYTILKKEKIGWFKELKEKFKNVKGTTFTDSDIKDGSSYSYKIFAIDKFGLYSPYSNEVTIKVPKQENSVKTQENVMSQENITVQPLHDININEK